MIKESATTFTLALVLCFGCGAGSLTRPKAKELIEGMINQKQEAAYYPGFEKREIVPFLVSEGLIFVFPAERGLAGCGKTGTDSLFRPAGPPIFNSRCP